MNDFYKYATKHAGISSLGMYGYTSAIRNSITPYILEERQLNVQPLDVFSRLMMERIIFMGMPIYDEVANIIQAQLLYLDSTDSGNDIQIYLNSP